MIEAVTGQKDKNGLYVHGLMDTGPKPEQYYIGYKAALMDFNNEVYNHLASIDSIKGSITILEDTEVKAQIYTKPMEDTRYAGGEKEA